jgi:hypothetical protein
MSLYQITLFLDVVSSMTYFGGFSNRYSSGLHDKFIRGGEGFICVYSITSKSSFHRMDDLRNKVLSVSTILIPLDFPEYLTFATNKHLPFVHN